MVSKARCSFRNAPFTVGPAIPDVTSPALIELRVAAVHCPKFIASFLLYKDQSLVGGSLPKPLLSNAFCTPPPTNCAVFPAAVFVTRKKPGRPRLTSYPGTLNSLLATFASGETT